MDSKKEQATMEELIRILSERVWGYSWSPVMTEVLQTIIERQWSTMRMQEMADAD